MSILDRYGIKEVADVTFYGINSNGTIGKPVLYLDTLKVSTIEQTAETADARGGKGNPKLITWDYGKEITVTLEDALFSAKSMAIMFGDGTTTAVGDLRKTVMLTVVNAGDATFAKVLTATDLGALINAGSISGLKYDATNGLYWEPAGMSDKVVKVKTGYKAYKADGTKIDSSMTTAMEAGEKVFVTFNYDIKGSAIEISANSFPGTYYITGDTYARSATSGEDEFFQFIIPKAKVTSENTITLEAEGDPSTFSMNLTVLRPDDGSAMMKLVKYNLDSGNTAGDTSPVTGDPVSTDAN